MPERMILRWEPVLPRDQPRGQLDVTWRWKAVVGRDRDCDIVLKHGSIPGRAGHFARLQNAWFVQDENPASGVYIDGEKVDFRAVGDRAIDFGMKVRFRQELVPMSAEELRLREAILADPDDDARFLVYADWLQEHGDEVGQLMVSAAPVAARWLGPLFSEGIEVKWRHGFLDTVKVRSAKSVYARLGVFNEVLVHPLSPFLRTLEVDTVLLAAEDTHLPSHAWATALFEALKREAPRALRTLKVRLPVEKRLGLEGAFDEARAKLPALRTRWDGLFTEGALP